MSEGQLAATYQAFKKVVHRAWQAMNPKGKKETN